MRTGFIAPVVALALTVGGHANFSRADSTINTSNKYAWGANVGWLDARGDVTNGAVIGLFFCSGYLWGANIGWINLGVGTPTNGYSYGNAGANDFGVNHDGLGALRGYAWGANVGWLNFESQGDPRVDLLTGNLSGYVWGANIGWISLSNAQAYVRTDTLDTGRDSDNDGIPDAWEAIYAGNLNTLSNNLQDVDGDGVPDADEFGADTDPLLDKDYLRITKVTATNGIPTAGVTWNTKATRLYAVDTTLKFTNGYVWTDSGLGVFGPDGGLTTKRDVAIGGPTGAYYRAVSHVPLQP